MSLGGSYNIHVLCDGRICTNHIDNYIHRLLHADHSEIGDASSEPCIVHTVGVVHVRFLSARFTIRLLVLTTCSR